MAACFLEYGPSPVCCCHGLYSRICSAARRHIESAMTAFDNRAPLAVGVLEMDKPSACSTPRHDVTHWRYAMAMQIKNVGLSRAFAEMDGEDEARFAPLLLALLVPSETGAPELLSGNPEFYSSPSDDKKGEDQRRQIVFDWVQKTTDESRPWESCVDELLSALDRVVPSAELARGGFDIEAHIAGLQWSPQATEHEKTLVAGNLRNLFGVLREKHNAFVYAARDVATGFHQYDKLFEALERDGHIKIEGNKVSVVRSATAPLAQKLNELDASRYRWLRKRPWIHRGFGITEHATDVEQALGVDANIDLFLNATDRTISKSTAEKS